MAVNANNIVPEEIRRLVSHESLDRHEPTHTHTFIDLHNRDLSKHKKKKDVSKSIYLGA